MTLVAAGLLDPGSQSTGQMTYLLWKKALKGLIAFSRVSSSLFFGVFLLNDLQIFSANRRLSS